MNKVQEGCKYQIPLDYEWEGLSPLRGLTCTVLEVTGMSKAGFDCFVKLDVSPEELAVRYSVTGGRQTTVEEVIEWHGEDNFHTDGFKYEPGLYIEHDTMHLIPLIDEALNDLNREYAVAVNKLWVAKHALLGIRERSRSLGQYARSHSTRRGAMSLYYKITDGVGRIAEIENKFADVVIDTSYRADQEIK